VGKKGVVREPKDHVEAIVGVMEAARELGWGYCGLTWSPLVGPAGNIEYLLWLREGSEWGMPGRPTVLAVALAAREALVTAVVVVDDDDDDSEA
jgi:23S rRNA (cytidine1920-2'-O)/16S rRNA (cytidine1409-2'-O)-methyltransferase